MSANSQANSAPTNTHTENSPYTPRGLFSELIVGELTHEVRVSQLAIRTDRHEIDIAVQS
jgi:hypothetical protein